MLSTDVHRDLTRYRPKVVFGLTARSLAATAAALLVGAACGLTLTVVWGIPFETASPAIYASTLPLWALGFWEPAGMRPEAWLPLWLRSHGGGAHITYDNTWRLRGAYGMDLTETYGRDGAHGTRRTWRRFAARQRGIERWRPSGTGAGLGQGHD